MSLRLIVSCHSEQNQRPEQNDRSLMLPFRGGLIAAVMDGVGSFSDGDLAAEIVRREFERLHRAPIEHFRDQPRESMDAVLKSAREEMLGHRGATTCTALLLLEDGACHVAHIGDSMLFRWRAGQTEALTQPHRHGRHVLSKALHGHPASPWTATCQWDLFQAWPAQPGDVYLLATDGCYEDIPTPSLSEMLCAFALPSDAPGPSPEQLRAAGMDDPARQFVAASIRAGAKDNSTAIVVRVGASC